MLPKRKDTKFGSSNQESSLSAGKNTRVVLGAYHTWKCVPTAFFGGVNVSEVHGCYLLQQMNSQ